MAQLLAAITVNITNITTTATTTATIISLAWDTHTQYLEGLA